MEWVKKLSTRLVSAIVVRMKPRKIRVGRATVSPYSTRLPTGVKPIRRMSRWRRFNIAPSPRCGKPGLPRRHPGRVQNGVNQNQTTSALSGWPGPDKASAIITAIRVLPQTGEGGSLSWSGYRLARWDVAWRKTRPRSICLEPSPGFSQSSNPAWRMAATDDSPPGAIRERIDTWVQVALGQNAPWLLTKPRSWLKSAAVEPSNVFVR